MHLLVLIKSFPIIPSTGMGKCDGTTFNSIGICELILSGMRVVWSVPNEGTNPSVIPTMLIEFALSTTQESLSDDSFIIEISA